MRFRVLALFLALFSVCGLRAHAQQTLGSVSGTVLDSTGAAIPDAIVTVSDADINVTRTAKTQSNGFFQIFNLPIGSYRVQAVHDGFDTTALTGISVQEAHTTAVNISLKIGQATTTVDVTATPLLNATDATNGYTLDQAEIAITPLATGSFTQLAVLSPGTSAELLANLDTNSGLGNQPIWANGQRDTSNTFQVNGVDATNLFNGKSSSGSNSQRYAFNIGQQAPVGGAAGVGTSVYGSNGNSLPSPPPEFLQELRVNTSLYDAQQGATSGAQIDANTLSGTNTLHGQLYGSFANNSLNADPFYFKQQYLLAGQGVGDFPESLANPALHRWTTGLTVGGPIIKDKLFFFASYQHRYNSDQATGLSQFTVPTGLTDDRSTAGLQSAASIWAGKAFTSAIDPIASSILNAKLPNGQFLIPSAPTGVGYNYSVPNITLIGTSVLTAEQAAASIDYDVSTRDRLSLKYYYQTDPVTKPYGYGQVGGFPVTQMNGAQVFAIDNTISFGSRVNWEQRLGFDRESSYSTYQQQLAGGNFGINGGAPAGQIANSLVADELPGLLLSEFATKSTSSPSLTVGPYSAFVNTGYYQNRINPSTNLIYTIGHHTLIAGGGFSYTQLNIENNRQGHAELKSKTFETFLMGATNGASVLESTDSASGRNDSDRYYRSNEIAGYAQDKWQALQNLTITVGVRYDYHGALTEKYGNIFSFDPAAYDVTGTVATGFQVNNPGFIVAGNNKQDPTAGTSDSTLTGRQWGVSPKVGFAWSPKMFNNKVVINGGAGIYFDRGELFTYLSQPAGSGNGGPFGVTESAPLASYVTGNGKTLENPFGSALTPAASGGTYVAPSANPATIKAALQNVLGTGAGAPNGYSGAKNPSSGQNCTGIDNQDNYTDCPDALNFAAYDRKNVLPYAVNYALNVQWQPRSDLAVTIGYSGNRGRHSVIPVPLNEPGIATATNPIHGETATYGFEVLNTNNQNNFGDYQPIATEPWNSEDGGNTDFRVPFIGFSPNAADFKTAGESAYDALQTHVEKRLAHNLAGGVSYTYSHALDEQSDIGLFFTGNNPNNLKQSYASADYDRTHVFTVNFQALLPDLAPKSSLLAYAANGWSLTGIGVVQSGQPYSLYEFYGAVGSAYFGDFPTLANPVLPVKDPNTAKKTAMTGNSGSFRGAGGSYIPTIDPSQIAINYIAPGQKGVPVSMGSDPQDIYETDFAPSDQRNIFRQPLQKRLDISVRKSFNLGSRFKMQYNFDVYNLFNTTSLDVPQNQTQIRQNYGCSTSQNLTAESNCANAYVNYGQIATANNTTDQQSTLTNLDQKPFTVGTGKMTTIPTQLQINQGSCSDPSIFPASGPSTCPNNGANFGSVTGTIGGGRAVVMGLHITY